MEVIGIKILKNDNDFLKFIQEYYSKNWIKIDDNFKRQWKIPDKYPCFVCCYKNYDPEAMWGNGCSKEYSFFYNNIEIIE